MSSKNEHPELKAGHPPAVKAGGMRIVQNKSNYEAAKNTNILDDDNPLKMSTSPPKSDTISGAQIHGNSDFTVQAVKISHEKPHPSKDNRSNNNVKPFIQQPKK